MIKIGKRLPGQSPRAFGAGYRDTIAARCYRGAGSLFDAGKMAIIFAKQSGEETIVIKRYVQRILFWLRGQ